MDPSDATGGEHLGLMGIEAASRDVGVSPSAIRLWERQGLIAPVRTRGGTRRFSADDMARLRAIHRLRTVDGLNAPAIRRLLDHDGTLATPGGHQPSAQQAGERTPASAGPSDPSVARRLRSMRRARGLTLQLAAERCGLSASFVSALERGLTGASISALRRLLEVYGATLGDLLSTPPSGSRLVTPERRRVLDTGAGVRIENLADQPAALESQLFVLAPGASSEGTYSHPGEEFMYVLSGRLAVWIDDREEYRLESGDALTFPSSLAHRFEALGPTETRLLWINTPPTF